MDVTNEMMIDLILNVAGFAAAGGLLQVVITILRERRRKVAAIGPANGATVPAEQPETKPVSDRPVEFIDFGQNREASGSASSPRPTSRRNRAEVLKQARSMIKAGASGGDVKSALPISDAELAVLSYESK